ncbi:MAG: hypothetical protein WDM79_10875 [Terricaulis sp.]
MTNAEIAGLWSAFDILLYPDDGSGVQACITSVLIDAQGVPRTQWSEAHNGYSPCPASTSGLLGGHADAGLKPDHFVHDL